MLWWDEAETVIRIVRYGLKEIWGNPKEQDASMMKANLYRGSTVA
jgi:hypothetical protein